MQTRLSVCNQVLFLTLEKGFSGRLQTLPWYPSACPAVWVLTLTLHPKTPLTPTTTTGSVPVVLCSRYQSKQKSHIFVERWTTQHHTLPCRSLFGQLSHLLSPRSCFQPGCAPRECPRSLGSESPMLKHENIFRQCQFKFAHQPYKYESPSPRDV